MREAAMDSSSISVADAIKGRQSIRAYTGQPVPRETIERILDIAARAPSGSNMQPWKVRVLTGAAKDELCKALIARHESGDNGEWEYEYYSDVWREPYLARRRQTGWGLYGVLGIPKGDREASRKYQGRNFEFFGAPVGLMFTIDRDLAKGSWLDYGMFLQSIMIAARAEGLETCPQAAFCIFHDTIQKMLAIPDGEMVVCGMAMGYADTAEKVNTFRTEREPVSRFATFLDRL
jgi:nitroreductase